MFGVNFVLFCSLPLPLALSLSPSGSLASSSSSSSSWFLDLVVMQLLLGAAFGAYVVAASTQRVAVEADSSAQPWMDLTLTPTQRAAALVKEMNLTEKVALRCMLLLQRTSLVVASPITELPIDFGWALLWPLEKPGHR